jgi:hypothetical protein
VFFILALTKVYEKANSVVSCDVICPTWLHKYIIGKKGASIQKLTCDLPKVNLELLQLKSSIRNKTLKLIDILTR